MTSKSQRWRGQKKSVEIDVENDNLDIEKRYAVSDPHKSRTLSSSSDSSEVSSCSSTVSDANRVNVADKPSLVGSPVHGDDINMDVGKELNSTQEMSYGSDDSSSEEERYELESDDEGREKNDGGGVDSKSKKECSLQDICKMLGVLKFRHGLTDVALKDLINYTSIIRPDLNIKSLYKMKKEITNACPNDIDKTTLKMCPQFIQIPICFHVLDVAQQIQLMFKRKDFFQHVSRPTFDDDLSDIVTSEEYKNGIGVERASSSSDIVISLQFHCDGVSVYDINNQLSVWPFYMVVNEMPLKYRFELSNLILFTCWPADIKLDRQRMQILLNKMVEMMLPYEHGITLVNPDGMSIK
ncbi:unnamed protein product, partial [Didymodactylos carnosus]